MPELPDVEMFRKQADKCRNSEIKSIKVHDVKFVKNPEQELNDTFSGNKFVQTVRRGKYLFLVTGKGKALALHFGMTGSLSSTGAEEELPGYTRCSILFKNGNSLHVLSKRKLGYVETTDDVSVYLKGKKLGTDALEIDRKEFLNMMKGKGTNLKTTLTDQSLISGIGNEYADEILFQARLHPRSRCNSVAEGKLNELYDKIKEVMETAVEKEADVSRLPGSYLLPVRKKGNDCPGCNGKIDAIKISGRTTCYCPSCQKSTEG